jgi:indolepyruvate ferredoxin oxidoreductase
VLVSDTSRHGAGLPAGVAVLHRDEMDRIQRELRDIPGCTVLIYEQTCASEKRRRRKRGEFADPPKRMFINPDVCEGCGDCSTQSGCVSIEPLETQLGRKRQINQSTCNKDYSCVKGFCPSFVTVYDAPPKKRKAALDSDTVFDGLPVPAVAGAAGAAPYGLMIAGIGGTGVITVGAVLAMAAHGGPGGVGVRHDRPVAEERRGLQPSEAGRQQCRSAQPAPGPGRGLAGAGLRHGGRAG